MKRMLSQVGTDTTYLLTSLPVAIPAFVIGVAGFAAGMATAVVWIGVPILALTLMALRGLAAAGRSQLPEVLRRKVVAPRYRRAAADASPLRRFLTALADGQSWLNLLWSIVNFPVAVAGFVIAVAWWAVTVVALAYPLYGWIIRRATGEEGDGLEHATRWLGWGDSYTAVAALTFLGGVVVAVLLPLVLRGAALTQAGIGKGLLASLHAGGDEPDQVTLEQRASSLDAELTRVRSQLHSAAAN